jgi:hypothetical protein
MTSTPGDDTLSEADLTEARIGAGPMVFDERQGLDELSSTAPRGSLKTPLAV